MNCFKYDTQECIYCFKFMLQLNSDEHLIYIVILFLYDIKATVAEDTLGRRLQL